MSDDLSNRDVDDEVVFVHVLSHYFFWVDNNGRLCSDTVKIGTSGYTWENGKWVDSED
jgi:hypothetical protein